MMYQKKSSLAVVFTAVCVTIITLTVVVLSLVFFTNLRSISHKQAETNMNETVSHLRDTIVSRLEKYSDLLNDSALGVASLFQEAGGDIPPHDIMAYFDRVGARISEITMLYYTNNIPWNRADGYAVFFPDWTPTASWDNTQRPWFTAAKQARGKVACTDPYVIETTGEIAIALSVTVYDENQTDIGVIGIDVLVTDLDTILHSKIVIPQQQTFLINKDGLYISHPDINAVMNKNFFTDMGLEQYRNQILSMPNFIHMDKKVYTYSSAIPNTDWVLVSTVPVSMIFSDVDALLMHLIIISLVLLLIAAGVSIVFTRKALVIPIQQVEHVAEALADMDFSVDIKKFRTDEIGNMQRALIKIRDSLRLSINELHDNLSKMTENSKRLNTVIVDSADSLGVIINNMDGVKAKTDSQMQSMQQTSNSLQEIIEYIYSLDQAVQNQSSHIAESSAAIEQMVANIASIRSVVANTSKTTDVLSKSSSSGHKMLSHLAEELTQIGERSKTLQGANKTIADIAGQTNILAMNAAIEAAHAGETGKGFAVVAGEIRKLAELSGKESESISLEIKKMEQAISQISKVSEETVGAMGIIFKEINAMDSSFTVVKHAVDEQAEGGSQILTALKGIQEVTVQVRDGSGAIHQRSSVIHDEMEKLHKLSEEVTESVHEVRLASGNISAFLENAKDFTGSKPVSKTKQEKAG